MKKAFLIGAGFSYDLGMPLANELTETFLSLFNQKSVTSKAIELSINEPYGEDRPINKQAILEALNLILLYKDKNEDNYEKILSEIQNLDNQHPRTQSDKDSYSYVFSVMYDIIWEILYLYQIKSYELIYQKNAPYYENIKNVLGDSSNWVFSLNHDLYVELLSLDFNIPITYGDKENILFPIDNIDTNRKINFTYVKRDNYNKIDMKFYHSMQGFNLIKLHGGLGEFTYKDKKLLCNLDITDKISSNELIEDFKKYKNMGYYTSEGKVPSGKDKVVTNNLGELDIIVKSMLTGGKKYSQTSNIKEGEEKLKIFDEKLLEIDELIIIGYGFGDEHINFRISNAMVKNDNLSLRIIDPYPIKTPSFLSQFDYDRRIKKAQCTANQWFDYCKEQTWYQDLNNSIKKNNELRKQIQNEVSNILGI